jgi:fermentation-respiration switch protein FrsA (DUF1100 family)
MLRTTLVVGLALLAAYLAALAYLFLLQRQYVFHPAGRLAAPAERGLADTQIVTLRAQDGVELTGWRRSAAAGRPTILYFHGNGGNISDRAERFAAMIGSGFGLLAFSYRGYPGSGGSPSQAALFSDALEVFDWLDRRTGGGIVLYGESLGSSVAVYVAAERKVDALLLEAPFTAALDIAAAVYPWVPVSLLMRDPFPTREYVGRVSEPMLIVHGADDPVIPAEHGRRLFDMAREPKQLAVIEGALHHDLWEHGLWRLALDFLKRHGLAAAAP